MLAFDKNMVQVWSPMSYLAKNTAAPFAQFRGMGDYDTASGYNPSGLGHIDCGCGGGCPECAGLGQIDPVTLAASAGTVSNFINNITAKFESWFGIGAGRREADIITAVQNELSSQFGPIFSRGQTADLAQSTADYVTMWNLGLAFVEFVSRSEFTDRRASGQALNGIMPMIDGTCGYGVPLPAVAVPSQRTGCSSFGVDWKGGALTSIGNRIRSFGGVIPALGDIENAAAQHQTPMGVQIESIPGTATPGTPQGRFALQTVSPQQQISQAFAMNVQQYLPYIVVGFAALFLLRATK